MKEKTAMNPHPQWEKESCDDDDDHSALETDEAIRGKSDTTCDAEVTYGKE